MIVAGQSIGNYKVLSKIGTGGMGAVYLAEHPLIGKKVALKVIHRELANNKEVVQRFFQEAKAVNQIGSEHIVEIHDFGVTPERDHFYIMEYLEGDSLATVLGRESVLDVMRTLHIGAQIASALGAAHACGVIHRDLKPDNVMLTFRLGDPNYVKLLDFGLAKMFASASAVKTAAGVLLGTPQYMSPEACESKPGIDHRTDIYALGILLFQMMTGVLPFDGESMGEVLVKQVTQLPPSLRGYNPSVPPAVEQLVLRCLAKSPDKRFPTMMVLRDALLDPERYLMQSPPIAPARSLAPGEAPADAKTVIAYAAQRLKTEVGPVGVLPLPPPDPSMIGRQSDAHRALTQVPDLAQPTAPKSHTMRIATPFGYSSRPPRKMWPLVLVFGLLLGLGGGAFAVAWFAESEAPAAAPQGSAAVTSQGVTSTAITTTGGTAAPQGSGTAAPQGSATAASQQGSGTGSATAASQQGSGTGSATAASQQGSGTGSATAASQQGSGTGSATVASQQGSGTAPNGLDTSKTNSAVAPAVVVIDSAPQGADVFGPDRKSLGKTPTRLNLPISDRPVTLELRLAGYYKKTRQLVVAGNTVVQVPLERLPSPSPSPTPAPTPKAHPAPAANPRGSDTSNLMRPDDE